MKIKKIILRKGYGVIKSQTELFAETEKNNDIVVYNEKEHEDKSMTIIMMPNTSGKSLIFNALEHLFSFVNERFIKDTNQDLETEIEFTLGSNEYKFQSNFYDAYSIYLNGDKLKDISVFENCLREQIGLNEGKLEYSGIDKNSLTSVNRFFFLNFSGIVDVETLNEMPLINTVFDGSSKKFILAYVLGAEIDNGHFRTLTEIEQKKTFIEEHKGKFEKYRKHLQTTELISDDINKLFGNLEEERIVYGDISIAIKELKKIKNDYEITFGPYGDDFIFLKGEIDSLEKIKEEISRNIKAFRETIKGSGTIEKKELLKDVKSINKPKDLLDFEKYERFKDDLSKINQLELDNYMTTNIEPPIRAFKEFITGLYNLFIKNAVDLKLLNKDDLFEHGNIQFDENLLNIKAFFNTSEGMRKTIRVLTFMGLQIYSETKKAKTLHMSFYDSFIENIDGQHRNVLFETIFQFIDTHGYTLPKMFLFITKIDSNSDTDVIYMLKNKYPQYIQLIESNGLK